MNRSTKKVLLTGAAGFVAGVLRTYWADRYELRLADIREIDEVSPHESLCNVDITDYDQMRRACEGMDTVVHLAADPNPRGEFYATLLPLNVIGTYNTFEAARAAGCRRVVFASSLNAVLGYIGESEVGWDVPVFPQNVYGVTKCWGEALARVYADQHGLSCICVRLGSPRFAQEGDWDADQPSDGISQRDTAQLFACCVDAENIDFAIVYGVSRHRRCAWDVSVLCKTVGYEPQDGTALPRAA